MYISQRYTKGSRRLTWAGISQGIGVSMTTVRNWENSGDLGLAMLAHLEERYRSNPTRRRHGGNRNRTS